MFTSRSLLHSSIIVLISSFVFASSERTFSLINAKNCSAFSESFNWSASLLVTTSSFVAASLLSLEIFSPVISSYAFIAPTNAAVPVILNGPATVTFASVTPAVVNAFSYIPAVQYVMFFVVTSIPSPLSLFSIRTEDKA